MNSHFWTKHAHTRIDSILVVKINAKVSEGTGNVVGDGGGVGGAVVEHAHGEVVETVAIVKRMFLDNTGVVVRVIFRVRLAGREIGVTVYGGSVCEVRRRGRKAFADVCPGGPLVEKTLKVVVVGV